MILGVVFYGVAAILALVGIIELSSGPRLVFGQRELELVYFARVATLFGGALGAAFSGYVCQKLDQIHQAILSGTDVMAEGDRLPYATEGAKHAARSAKPVARAASSGTIQGPTGPRSYRETEEGEIILQTMVGEKRFASVDDARRYITGAS
jgi:hypothetical protein